MNDYTMDALPQTQALGFHSLGFIDAIQEEDAVKRKNLLDKLWEPDFSPQEELKKKVASVLNIETSRPQALKIQI